MRASGYARVKTRGEVSTQLSDRRKARRPDCALPNVQGSSCSERPSSASVRERKPDPVPGSDRARDPRLSSVRRPAFRPRWVRRGSAVDLPQRPRSRGAVRFPRHTPSRGTKPRRHDVGHAREAFLVSRRRAAATRSSNSLAENGFLMARDASRLTPWDASSSSGAPLMYKTSSVDR